MRQFLYNSNGRRLLTNISRNDERIHSSPIRFLYNNFIQSRGFKNSNINPSSSSPPPSSPLSPSNTTIPSFDVSFEEIPSSPQEIKASKPNIAKGDGQQRNKFKNCLLQQDAITRELWSQSVDYKNRIRFTRPKEVYDFIIIGAGSAGCV